MKMVLSSSILMSSETFVEEQKMGKLQCEYICFMQEYFCNYYIHDTDTHTCTWGKVIVKIVCQNFLYFYFQTNCINVEASGEDAVTLYLKEDQETLCPFKEDTISPDSCEFFKNKTIENWQTTLSECQVFCMKMESKCNFVHFDSEHLSCSWVR